MKRSQSSEDLKVISAFNVYAKSGLDSDFAKFYELQRPSIQGLISRTLNRKFFDPDVEDLTSIFFNKVVRAKLANNLPEDRNKTMAWLYIIAKNTSVTFMTQHWFSQKRGHSKLNLSFGSPAPEDQYDVNEPLIPSALHAIDDAHLAGVLDELMEKAKFDDRWRSVYLHEVKGLSYGEIAKEMGITAPTARSRAHYARKEMQGFLQERASGLVARTLGRDRMPGLIG